MGISGEQFADEAEAALKKLPKVSGGGQVYLTQDLNKVLIDAEDEQRRWGTNMFPLSICSYAC